jgi:hypothetical protein
MKIQLCILCVGLGLAFSKQTAAQNLNPKYSGQLWFDTQYQDRYNAKTLKFQIPRALIGVDVSLTTGWNLSMSYIASTEGNARVNHAYIENTKWLPAEGIFRLGRVKLPYHEFTERSFSHRWAFLRNQAEIRDFISYREQGLQAFFKPSDSFEVAFMVRNGAEPSFSAGPSDAKLAWIGAAHVSLSDTLKLNSSVDFQEKSEDLGQAARLAWVNSIGFKGVSTAWLAELNAIKIYLDDPQTRIGASVQLQYSFEDTVTADKDVGLFTSVYLGNSDYKTYGQETLRFSMGPYFQISKNLRTAFQGFYYQGIDSSPNSDGYLLVWNWEARF